MDHTFTEYRRPTQELLLATLVADDDEPALYPMRQPDGGRRRVRLHLLDAERRPRSVELYERPEKVPASCA